MTIGAAAMGFMAALMTNPDITKVGLGFRSDKAKLQATFPGFPTKFESLFDISAYDKRGLAKLCLEELGAELCKVEQRSNWERRPLRLS